MKHCRICKGDRLENVLSLGDQPHCNSFLKPDALNDPEPRWPLELFYCHDCHLAQLGYVVDPDVMFREFLYTSGTTKTLREHFQQTAEMLKERYHLSSDDFVVDIGSNDGTWLKCFKSLGLKVLGVDPALNLAQMANADGIPTLAEYFNEEVARRIKEEHGPASVITAAGVFFHIDDMDEVCRGIQTLLADRGVLHIQAIYLGNVLMQNSFDNIYHEHLSLYTLHPLIRLFERFSMTVFDVSVAPIHGGSLMLHVCRQGAHPVQSSVAAQLTYERQQGWTDPTAYRAFARRVADIRTQLRTMLKNLKQQGKRIAAYAAPAKGNTLLNYCGIGPELLDYAVERSELKVGRFTPGTHLPVIHESVAMQDPPDYFLLLAWNFKEELIAKNSDFLEKGGRFIVPIPEPHVISKGETHVPKSHSCCAGLSQ